jgi:hypothetical protein
MADLERPQGDRIGHAQAEHGRKGEGGAALCAHLGEEPYAECGRCEQAGKRDHPVHSQVAAAPQRGKERERGSLDQ